MRRLLAFAMTAFGAAVGVLLVLIAVSFATGGVSHVDLDRRLERVETQIDFIVCVQQAPAALSPAEVIAACQFPG